MCVCVEYEVLRACHRIYVKDKRLIIISCYALNIGIANDYSGYGFGGKP